MSLELSAEESLQSSDEEGVVTGVCVRTKTLPVRSTVKYLTAGAVSTTRRCPTSNRINHFPWAQHREEHVVVGFGSQEYVQSSDEEGVVTRGAS